MSDNTYNYAEEIAPLLKLLRTPAFRFIIVGYNHGSLLRRLEGDLRQRFPDRPFLKLDTQKVDYRQISDAYAALGSGFFWLENFHDALREERDSLGKETPEMTPGNERRRHIVSGLNLRRDRLARSPVALFVFIPIGAGRLYGRDIMEKMPDLWSFRSFILDLNYQPETRTSPQWQVERQEMSTLGGATKQEKTEELARLLRQLETTPEAETAYRLTLYPQIASLLTELGQYNQALGHLDDWGKIVPPDGLGDLWEKKAELFDTSGLLAEALTHFKKAFDAYNQMGDKSNMATCHRRIGDVYQQLGNLEKATDYFLTFRQLATELAAESPDNLWHKNDIGLAHERLGNIYADKGLLTEALTEFKAYNQVESELFAAAPDNSTFKNNLAISFSKLGSTHTALGNLQQALTFFEERSKLGQALYADYPDNVNFKNGLAISYEKLGETHTALGNLQHALTFFEERSKLAQALYADYPNNVNFKNGLAISYEKLGETHAALGNLQHALTFFEQYNQLEKVLYADYPDNVNFKNGLAISFSKLGETHTALGNLQQALTFFEQYSQLEKALYADYPDNVNFKNGLAISYSQLGRFYRDKMDDPERAKAFFQQCYTLWKELSAAYPAYKVFSNNFNWAKNALGVSED